MSDERNKRWVAVIVEQRVCTADTELEANDVALRKLPPGIRFEVRPRPHSPEQCWCGDDHSP
jgi:hypothetical protein